MSVKPITPDEALSLKVEALPAEIIETVNTMLAEQVSISCRATLLQKEICERAIQLFAQRGKIVTSSEIYDRKWMDFEPAFRQAGWKVVYDKPAYCENYEPNFTFSRG